MTADQSVHIQGKGIKVSGNGMAILTGGSIVAILVIIYMFIHYLEVHEKNFKASQEVIESAHQKVADLRIQQCHDIQIQGIEAMTRMAAAYDEQSVTLSALTESMRALDAHMREQTAQLRELRADLDK